MYGVDLAVRAVHYCMTTTRYYPVARIHVPKGRTGGGADVFQCPCSLGKRFRKSKAGGCAKSGYLPYRSLKSNP